MNDKVEIRFNDFSVPIISLKDSNDKYFANGYIQAKLRLFQLEYYRLYSQGLLSNFLGKEFVEKDLITRRIIPLSQSIVEYENLNDTLPYYQFTQGINKHLELITTLPLEFGLLNIPKKKWQSWEVYHLSKFKSINPINSLTESIENYFVNKSSLNNNIKNQFANKKGLNSIDLQSLISLKKWFNDLSTESSYLLNYKIDSNNYSMVSFFGELEMPQSSICVIDISDSTKIDILEVGSLFSSYTIGKSKNRFNQTISTTNFEIVNKIDDSRFELLSDTLKADFSVDSILAGSSLKYLIQLDSSYVLNINEKNDSFLTIDVEHSINHLTPENNNYNLIGQPVNSMRINSLINNVIKFNNLEFQLIANDNYDEVSLKLIEKTIQKIDKKQLKPEQRIFINEILTWDSNTNFSDSLAAKSLSFLYSIIDNSISYFIEHSDLIRLEKKYILYEAILEDYNFEKLILSTLENLKIDYQAPIRNFQNQKLKVNIFEEMASTNGSINSIKYYNKDNYVGTNLTIIFDKNSNIVDLQMLGGFSGEINHQNFKDLFSLWKTNGFYRIDLNDLKYKDSIIFVSK